MTFDYNTTRKKLLLSEYGRNVQNMVEYVKNIESKEERNKYAQAVIELMGQLNPHLRDVADFKHKLWDHLFIISGYNLDVDSPYPLPQREIIERKPERIGYPHNKIRFKHYGHAVELMIEKAKNLEDPERKAQYVSWIANFMKMAYVTWNKDHVADETIINDLKLLSKGELTLAENTSLNQIQVRTNTPVRQNNNFKNRKKNTRPGKRY